MYLAGSTDPHPVLPGDPLRNYRDQYRAQYRISGWLSASRSFYPVVAPVVARYYREGSTTGPGGPVLPLRAESGSADWSSFFLESTRLGTTGIGPVLPLRPFSSATGRFLRGPI